MMITLIVALYMYLLHACIYLLSTGYTLVYIHLLPVGLAFRTTTQYHIGNYAIYMAV